MPACRPFACGVRAVISRSAGSESSLDDQGVVAGAGERRGQAGEDALAVVLDRAGLAVHELLRAHHVATEGLADGLMAQADAKDGRFAGHVTDERNQDAGLDAACRGRARAECAPG